MHNLTYRELATIIDKLPDAQKDDNITINLLIEDEMYPVSGYFFTGDTSDVVEDCLVLTIDK